MPSHEIQQHSRIQGIGWFARRVPDPHTTVAFYRDVMGLPFLRGRPTSGMLWSGDGQVLWVAQGGVQHPEYTDRDQAACVPVYRVRGIDGVKARLEGGGAKFINDFNITEGRIAYFLDPSGNVTGIQERWPTTPRPEDHEAQRRWDAGETTVEGIPALPGDIQGLGWVVMRVEDQQAEIAFYRDVLGFYPTSPTGPMLGLGEMALLEILPGGTPQPMPSDRSEVSNHMILRTHDFAGLVEHLDAHGVRWVNEAFRGSGMLAYFLDPEGRLVGIQQRMPDSDPRPEDADALRRWEAAGLPVRF